MLFIITLQHYCLSLGGHLARIETEAEKNLIHELLKHLPGERLMLIELRGYAVLNNDTIRIWILYIL